MAFQASFFTAVVTLLTGGVGLPLGVPPTEDKPVLARVAPPQCLFYAQWNGVAAADENSTNRTEQLLAEAEVRHFLQAIESVLRSGFENAAQQQRDPAAQMLGNLTPRLTKLLLTRSTAVFVEQFSMSKSGPRVRGALVMHAGESTPAIRQALVELQQQLAPDAVESVEIEGTPFFRLQPSPESPTLVWGTKGDYLTVAVGEGVIDEMLERVDGQPPQWLNQLHARLPVERRSSVAYINLAAIRERAMEMAPQTRPVLLALGLDNVLDYMAATGLDSERFISRSLVRLDGDPRGILQLATAQPLHADDLKVVPADVPIAMVGKLDAAQFLEALLEVAGAVTPAAAGATRGGLEGLSNQLGFSIQQDLLASLGDEWRLYAAEDGGLLTGWTLSVSVDDRGRLESVQRHLLQMVESQAQQGRPALRVHHQELGDDMLHVLTLPDDAPFSPSWSLTDEELVIALYPQAVKSHLLRKPQRTLADVPEVAARLEGEYGALALSFVDERKMLAAIYPLVQIGFQAAQAELRKQSIQLSLADLPSGAALRAHLAVAVTSVHRPVDGLETLNRQTLPAGNLGASAPVAVGLLLPALEAGRQTARRKTSTTNLKMLVLAMHNFHDTRRGFPAAYNTDPDGKPLLSWRVQLLPFLEQQTLYDQFRFDEPWDSEHNKQLIAQMPDVLRAPGSQAEPGRTNYVAIRDDNAALQPPKEDDQGLPHPTATRLADFTDGTSNTILLVEAADSKAVIWTKPDDLELDPDDPAAGLVGLRQNGFLAAFADGSVRLISSTGDKPLLRALFTRNGGEAVAVP